MTDIDESEVGSPTVCLCLIPYTVRHTVVLTGREGREARLKPVLKPVRTVRALES